jgi:hypothetical protein
MARRTRGMSVSARWLAGVLIAVLAIVTVVLAVLAIQRTRATFPNETPAPVPTFSFQPAESPSAEPSAAASEAPPASAAEQRFLAVGAGELWRATAGACGEVPPLIERSSDDGRTWVDVTPLYRQIAEVVSLDSFAGTEAETIAAVGADCEVQALRTFTQGEFWSPYDDVLAASRYADPAAPQAIVTPQGAVEAPCAAPTSVRAAGDTVALVCDGVASRLDGAEWVALPAQGVVAVAIFDGEVFAAAADGGCSGAAVTRFPADGASEAVGCAAEASISTPLALAVTADEALLWSGDRLLPLPR